LKHADFQIICDAGNQRFWRIQPIQLDAIFKYIQHDLTTFKPTFPILYRYSTIDFDLFPSPPSIHPQARHRATAAVAGSWNLQAFSYLTSSVVGPQQVVQVSNL
jgi:hypothetical protein